MNTIVRQREFQFTAEYDQGDEGHQMDLGIGWHHLVPFKSWVSFSFETLLLTGENQSSQNKR